MLSSTDAKLMGRIKPIIAQNIVAQLSYLTGVGSNPARSQFFFQFFFSTFTVSVTRCSTVAT